MYLPHLITSNTISYRFPPFITSEESDPFVTKHLIQAWVISRHAYCNSACSSIIFMQHLSNKQFRTLLLITSQRSCMWPSHWYWPTDFLLQQESSSSLSMKTYSIKCLQDITPKVPDMSMSKVYVHIVSFCFYLHSNSSFLCLLFFHKGLKTVSKITFKIF